MLLWIPTALAVDVPDFVAGQHVYVSPGTAAFAHTRTDAATGATHEPINVVVYETVIRNGAPTRSSFTEDALEETLAAWRADPDFQADKDSLVVLGLDDREVRLVAGSTWDTQLRLHNDTLLPLIDEAFMPVAMTGDLDGGLAALVARFDNEIEDRKLRKDAGKVPTFDPARRVYVVPDGFVTAPMTEAAAAAAKPPVYVVFYERAEGLDNIGLREASATTFRAFTAAGMPKDAALVVVAADAGKWEATAGDLRSELLERSWYSPGGSVYELDETGQKAVAEVNTDLDLAIAARKNHDRNVLAAEIGVPSFAFLGLGGFAAALVMAARSRFRDARDTWQETLTKGRENVEMFRTDTVLRDKIVDLRLRGPVTLKLVDHVTTLIDEIEVGVRALDGNLVACEAAGGWMPGAWGRATEKLSEPFEFDTGKAQQRLFGGPTKVVTISPDEFVKSLDAKYSDAKAGWARLLDAVDASLRRASDDFPTDDLQKMRAALGAAGLPESWVATHPLLGDAEGTWARLDELRKGDPVAYVDELTAAIALDDQLEADVATVVAAVTAARQSRAKADAIALDAVNTTITSSPRHPGVALSAAQAADDALAAEIADDPHTDDLVARANASRDAWDFVAKCRTAVIDAVTNAATRVTEAATRVASLDRDVASAVANLGALLPTHTASSVADAWVEVKEAQQDVSEAKAALAEAQRLLAEGAHLGADDAAAVVREEHGQGTKNLAELVAILNAVVRAEQDAKRGLAELQARRSNVAAELLLYSGPASSLAAGDALFGQLQRSITGPIDWRSRANDIVCVNAAWTGAVTSARVEHERREAARKEAERQAAAAAAAAAARARAASSRSSSYRSTSSSSSSWGSSSRSSSSSSSSRSSSSSSSSAGRSYSSSSSSSGRSFSSGGRSAGRKF